jgi:hypothetical protein
MQRDHDKEQYFKQQQVSLVLINHRWNGTWSQLKANIRQIRPGKLCFHADYLLSYRPISEVIHHSTS